jgi:molecular chaperone DnaK
MATFGIDLGTTYSCIAYVDESGRPTLIKNALGEDTTPSVVYFETPDNVVVGRDAKNSAKLYPELVVSLIKREMGEDVEYSFHGELHTPETISALILRELTRSAAEQTGAEVRDVVITVPAYFGVAEREATRNAGRVAGLNVLNVVPEPVAAALHYQAVGSGADRTILVFDLGGGTFDTTVIKLSGNDITVVCTDGDHRLGGANWDDEIVEFLLNCFLGEHPDSAAASSEEFRQELSTVAEEMKKSLSSTRSRRYAMSFGGDTSRAELTRDELEDLGAGLLERTMDITERTVKTAREAGITHFDDVLLVGGSTRAPAVAARLRERFGFEPRLHDPDQAVAKGAALFALIQSVKILLPDGPDGAGGPQQRRLHAVSESEVEKVADQLGMSAEKVRQLARKRVTTVVPRAFGVKVLASDTDDTDDTDNKEDGSEGDTPDPTYSVVHILEANRPLPASPDTQQFFTAYADQTAIEVEIWEQAGSVSSTDLPDNNKIGDGIITGLPPLPKGSPIDVNFSMDDTGLLRVEAVELKTRTKLTIELQIQGLSDAQVDEARTAVARYALSE